MHMRQWLSLPDENWRNPTKCKPRKGWRALSTHRGESFLYAIECDGFIKMGVSDAPDERARDIQTCSPHPVRVLQRWRVAKCRRLEVELLVHELLRSRRVRNEWFRVTLAEAGLAVERAMLVRLAIEQNTDLARNIQRPLSFINGELDALPSPSVTAEGH